MVANENNAVECLVNALHHHQRPREAAHDRNIPRKLLDQQIQRIAVRVADQDLRCPGLEGSLDRSVHFLRHKFSKALILKAGWSELIARNRPDNSFHVGGDIDLHFLLLCGDRYGKTEQQKRKKHQTEFHFDHSNYLILSKRVLPPLAAQRPTTNYTASGIESISSDG